MCREIKNLHKLFSEENMKLLFWILRKAWGLIMTREEQRYITGVVEKAQEALTEISKELRQLTAEFREHKGEFKEFKQHVMGRVEKLEKKEAERGRERLSVISILISGTALAISVIVNFFRNGGK
jgi:predicted nuclease with TOPRIM domain